MYMFVAVVIAKDKKTILYFNVSLMVYGVPSDLFPSYSRKYKGSEMVKLEIWWIFILDIQGNNLYNNLFIAYNRKPVIFALTQCILLHLLLLLQFLLCCCIKLILYSIVYMLKFPFDVLAVKPLICRATWTVYTTLILEITK